MSRANKNMAAEASKAPVTSATGTCQHVKKIESMDRRTDGASIFWESIRNLERRQKDEVTAEGKEEVSDGVAIKFVNLKSKAHQDTAGSKAEASQQEAYSGAIAIKQSTHGQSGQISGGRGKCEEEVESQVLLQAYIDALFQLLGGTEVLIDAFLDEDGFECGKAEDDAAGKPAGEHSCNYLSCVTSQRGVWVVTNGEVLYEPMRFGVETVY